MSEPKVHAGWQKKSFFVAVSDSAPLLVKGYARDGLGIHLTLGRRGWTVIHLGTGAAVSHEKIRGAAQQAGDELLGLGSWEFVGINGWKNMRPDLDKKYREWFRGREKNKGRIFRGPMIDECTAQLVAERQGL